MSVKTMLQQQTDPSGLRVCIIPARGGSKRLPRKNILPFNGVALIGWAVGIAKSAKSIDLVCVTSDDREIREAAKASGADITIDRPAELATDTATSIDVLLHALGQLEQHRRVSHVVLLQATAPLTIGDDIDKVLALLESPEARSVVSVCPPEHSPLWSNTLTENGMMDRFYQAGISNVRSQDLPPYYRLNGAVYATTSEVLKSERSFLLSHGTRAYIMPTERSVDIDTKLDWDIAEFLHQRNW